MAGRDPGFAGGVVSPYDTAGPGSVPPKTIRQSFMDWLSSQKDYLPNLTERMTGREPMQAAPKAFLQASEEEEAPSPPPKSEAAAAAESATADNSDSDFPPRYPLQEQSAPAVGPKPGIYHSSAPTDEWEYQVGPGGEFSARRPGGRWIPVPADSEAGKAIKGQLMTPGVLVPGPRPQLPLKTDRAVPERENTGAGSIPEQKGGRPKVG